jgi:branched-chain amino acid transport system substrate-binding protein
MRKKWFTLLAMSLALALVAAACGDDGDGGGGDASEQCAADEFGCVEVAEGAAIQVGTLLVISGPNAALGLDSQHGVEIALDMKGEVLGHSVELVNQDDGCAAEGGQTGAQALVSQPEIVGVIGTSCSSAAVPAAEILSAQGVLLFSSSNTAPDLTDPATHQPFYARTAHNDKIQGAAMAQFVAEELEGTSAATIHDGSPYAEGLANVFAETFQSEYDGEITVQEAVQVGDKDFRPVLTAIGATSPDYLYYPVFIPEGAAITQQARQVGALNDTDLGGADGMLSPDFVDAAGEASEGMFLSGPSLAFAGDFYQDEFLPAYQEAFGEEPAAAFHAHAFDATNILLNAIEEVAIEEDGALFIPRTALRDAVFATDGFEGITGSLTCDENGDCQQTATMAVNLVENGAFDPIFEATLELPEG